MYVLGPLYAPRREMFVAHFGNNSTEINTGRLCNSRHSKILNMPLTFACIIGTKLTLSLSFEQIKFKFKF